MRNYYIVVDGSQKGPFSLEELREEKITKNTLVWTETMDNWIEAENVEELKNLIKIIPPPIPMKQKSPIKVEAEISKKKDKFITPTTKIIVAKETKTNFKMILYALILGVLSFPVFFTIEDGFKHINMAIKWNKFLDGSFNYNTASEEAKEKRNIEYKALEIRSKSLGYGGSNSSRLYFHYPSFQYHEDKFKEAANNSILPAAITALIASLTLIVGRYIIKGAKWIEETSKK